MKKFKTMKKLFAVSMIFAALTSFVGCGSGGDDPDPYVPPKPNSDGNLVPAFTSDGWEHETYDNQTDMKDATTKWCTTEGNCVVATYDVDNDGKMVVNVTKYTEPAGEKDYHAGIPLKHSITPADKVQYDVKFVVESEVGKKLKWMIISGGPNFRYYCGAEKTLESATETIEGTFTLDSENSDDNLKFLKDLVTNFEIDFRSTGTFKISNVEIKKHVESEPKPPVVFEKPANAVDKDLTTIDWKQTEKDNNYNIQKTATTLNVLHTARIESFKAFGFENVNLSEFTALHFTVTNNDNRPAYFKINMSDETNKANDQYTIIKKYFLNGTNHNGNWNKDPGIEIENKGIDANGKWEVVAYFDSNAAASLSIMYDCNPWFGGNGTNSEENKPIEGSITISDFYLFKVNLEDVIVGEEEKEDPGEAPAVPTGCTFDYSDKEGGAEKRNVDSYWDTFEAKFDNDTDLTGKSIVVCYRVSGWSWNKTDGWVQGIDLNICSEYATNGTDQKASSKKEIMGATPNTKWTIKTVDVTDSWDSKDVNGTKATISAIKAIRINTREGKGDLYVRYINIVDTVPGEPEELPDVPTGATLDYSSETGGAKALTAANNWDAVFKHEFTEEGIDLTGKTIEFY